MTKVLVRKKRTNYCSALPPDGKCFVCHQEAELTDGTLFSLSRSLAENWVTEDIFMHNKRPSPNFSITLSVLRASVCDLYLVAIRLALLYHNITRIRLNRVTHVLCFYGISLFGFACAAMS